ncbi:MAG: relaxase domain-containing protein [Mycobacteriaceae bacterium]|nr:relaxase domain-containing protein [Mycobacteriaceae bacterium]MBV9639647.1 relaxase domain-containing protein [Mycobacteriaceae bacterium]
MGLHKLTAGDGYLYLIRQVAAVDGTDKGRASLADFYSAKGESPGVWLGSGLAALCDPLGRDTEDAHLQQLWSVPQGSAVTENQMKALFGEGLHPNADDIVRHVTGAGLHGAAAVAAARLGRPFRIRGGESEFRIRLAAAFKDAERGRASDAPLDPDARALIRTRLATRCFIEHYGRPPQDDRELTGFVARSSRKPTTAVAGYDLTFSPVKSVSALWAIAPRTVAQRIEDCHHNAVADTLAFLERNAAFTRLGTNGIQQVDTTGLIAAAFTHRDNRAGSPDLHTHVTVSNKVRAVGHDGIPRWLALDGTPLYKVTVAASELYNTRLEAHLGNALGVQFAPATPQRRHQRPVREIVGMSAELLERWSSRRIAIENRIGDLAKLFQARHGREPTTIESLALAQQASLETRAAKHQARSLAEQRHTWRTEAIETLGGYHRVAELVNNVTGRRTLRTEPATAKWIDDRAAEAIGTLSSLRATWQRTHVLAEAQRIVRATGHAADAGLAERITANALTAHSIRYAHTTDEDRNEPAPLRRRGGASVYSGHDTAVYTSHRIVQAERRILAAAGQKGGRRADVDAVAHAFAEQRANGRELNAGQGALVREMATSGCRVQLALAPAGTGKTTAMAALAHAWHGSGGNVIGLAPTAAAAEVLRGDLNTVTDTVAKYVHLAAGDTAPHDRDGRPVTDDARSWFDTVTADTLLIVDEAGMCGTRELDAVIAHATTNGASIRLIGDDGQLASISAGGVLRDIAHAHDTVTLTELVRFRDERLGAAEGAASLAIRAGDPAGIGFYIDHHRVHVGADATAAEMAYTAWRNDTKAAKDAVLLAPTNYLVAGLNERARLDRLTETRNSGTTGRTVVLADGLTASEGDVVCTRRNARWLRLNKRDWVRNGHRWRVTRVQSGGALTVSHLTLRTRVTLPADYVRAHTTLGYACTIDAAQGVTADTSHVVGCDALTRQQLYVALTRGRYRNELYFSTAESDPHRILTPKATRPPTAVDLLTAIVSRDGAQTSATTAARRATDPFARLRRCADMYVDAIGSAAEHQLGRDTMSRIDAGAEELRPGMSGMPAWPVLRKHLAMLAIAGDDPLHRLQHALATQEVDTVHDAAAVLDWRLTDPAGTATGPLRWLPAVPPRLHQHPHWGPYLAGRAALVTDLADAIRAAARGWTAATAPLWARPLINGHQQLLAELAVFRAATGVDANDDRPAGPPQYPLRARVIQRLLEGRAAVVFGRPGADTARWRAMADRADPRLRRDPYWPQLAGRLDVSARAGLDVQRLIEDALHADGPLPDELPAAALWWRLAGTLGPATVETTATALRPDWVPELRRLFGPVVAEAIIADPAWSGLVAAVNAADPRHWTPAELLAAAAEHLLDAAVQGAPVPLDEYARVLTYRVDLFAGEAAHLDEDISGPKAPPDPAEAGHELAVLTDAGHRSSAGILRPAPHTLDGLNEADAEAVSAVASSPYTVIPLAVAPDADKTAALIALRRAAETDDRRVLLCRVADTAEADTGSHAVAHTIAGIERVRERLDSRRWTIPPGAIVVVDDAGQLGARDIAYLARTAKDADAKLVLVADLRRSPNALFEALRHDLPWAQTLGSPDADRDRTPPAQPSHRRQHDIHSQADIERDLEQDQSI